jgi:hypothetical protein
MIPDQHRAKHCKTSLKLRAAWTHLVARKALFSVSSVSELHVHFPSTWVYWYADLRLFRVPNYDVVQVRELDQTT